MGGVKLNPQAQPFLPTTRPQSDPILVPSASGDDRLPEDPFEIEYSVSPMELEELEEVEQWVNLMAELEGLEQDHLIELSLRHADKGKIAQIKAAVMASGKHKHRAGHHAHHKAAAAAPKA